MNETQAGRLSSFVRSECANYDQHYGLCMEAANQDQPCLVLAGKPCRYFERAVLGPPDYPYQTAGYDWPKLFEAYGQINLRLAGRAVAVRRCECGTALAKRERVCAKCRTRRRQDAYRQYRAKKHRRATVDEAPSPDSGGIEGLAAA